MNRRNYARLAGFTFLFYIANGIADMIVSGRVRSGPTTAAKLANIAQHVQLARLGTFLTFLTAVDALVLGLALYAITRDTEPDLALLALLFRVGEGIVGAVAALKSASIIEFATRCVPSAGTDVLTVVGASLLYGGGATVGATLFAIGSTIFAYLFVRNGRIPAWLAWLGIVSSLILVVALSLQMAGVAQTGAAFWIWMPMLVYEVVLGFLLLIKGDRIDAGSTEASSGSRP